MSNLSELGLVNVSYLLESGVYVLVYKGEIMYVGKSRRVLRRVPMHIGAIPFDEIHVMLCKNEGEMESYLIARLHPRYNKMTPGSPFLPIDQSRPGVVHNPSAKRRYNAAMSKIVKQATSIEEGRASEETVDDMLDEIHKVVGRESW